MIELLVLGCAGSSELDAHQRLAELEERSAAVEARSAARSEALSLLEAELLDTEVEEPLRAVIEVTPGLLSLRGVNLWLRADAEGRGGSLLLGEGAEADAESVVIGAGRSSGAGALVVGGGEASAPHSVSIQRGLAVASGALAGFASAGSQDENGVDLGYLVAGSAHEDPALSDRVEFVPGWVGGQGDVALFGARGDAALGPTDTVLVTEREWSGTLEQSYTFGEGTVAGTILGPTSASLGAGAEAAIVLGGLGGAVSDGASWATVLGGLEVRAEAEHQVCVGG